MTPTDFKARFRRLLAQMYSATPGAEWGLSADSFSEAVHASWQKHGERCEPEAYLRSLRLRDLALAQACAGGSEAAWRVFFNESRESLRSAGLSLAGQRGEEVADALFGDLYQHKTKLASFAGRSSLGGWLRAVLYQSYVDRYRKGRREVSLEEREETGAPPVATHDRDAAEQVEYEQIAQRALEAALRVLPPRQKLLLDFYYFHALTLREAAALVGVHEATASRELDRARAALRKSLTDILRKEYRLGDEEVRRCFYEAVRGGLEIEEHLQEPGDETVQKQGE
jgi:RNA polymerase sigma-70 factor, ECF subfamily